MVTVLAAKGKRRVNVIDVDEDDDEDDISVTSTVDENAAYDQEYLVKDILAENEDEDGKLYLVEWADYALEHCTWEPADQIGPEIIDEFWTKPRQQPDYKPFDLSRYDAAVAEWAKRHERRNAKRKRCGLPQTKLDSAPGTASPSETDNKESTENTKANAPKTRGPAEKSGSSEPPSKKKKTLDGSAVIVSTVPARKTAAGATATKKSDGDAKPKERPPARRETTDDSHATKPVPPSSGRSRPAAAVQRRTTWPAAFTARTTASSSASGPARPTIRTAAAPATARRTLAPMQRPSTGARAGTGNAFAEGRMPRKPTLLEDIAGDPTRHSTFFNYRVRRISELRERSRPEAAIDPAALSGGLFPITADPSFKPRTDAQEAPASDKHGAAAAAAAEPEAVKKPKKRRTVRFLDDSDSGPGGDTIPATANRSETHVPAVPMQSVKRTLVLGSRQEPVAVLMDGKVLAAGAPRLADILDDRPLHFQHVCLAETLAVRFKQIHKSIVFHGNVSAAAVSQEERAKQNRSPDEVLETVAVRLETMASGLFLAWPRKGILLYPARGDDWKEEELFGLPVLQNTTKAPLRCVVFTSPFDMTPFLRSPPAALSEKQGLQQKQLDVPPDMSVREHLLRQFFHFDRADYLPLFPTTAQDLYTGQRSLFLAFPPMLGESMYQLAKWLRMIDPQCLLYLCSQAGAWRAFQHRAEMSKKKPDFGAVLIVHELATWSVRRFPGISSLAEQANCRVWSLSQAMMETALFPLRPNVEERPGHVRWTRLFPDGLAILVTPSFVVTEPERMLELLMWCFHLRQMLPDASLQMMVPANFGDFLLELAEERARQRELLLDDRSLKTGQEREKQAAQKGITHALCQCRFKTWLLFCRQQRLYRAHRHRDGKVFGEEKTEEEAEAEDNEDENGPFVYADAALDGNDEQSLVNYFAYWATERMDRFRSFCVVGSNNSATQKFWARRRIRIPAFAAELMGQPNGALEPGSGNEEYVPTAAALASRRAINTTVESLSDYLMAYNRAANFWRIYGFPILWIDREQAAGFGVVGPPGPGNNNSSIEDWFRFTWSFLANKGKFRTYVGMFYMLDDDEAVDTIGRTEPRPRHPWVAIYRPVNANRRPYTQTEIIIWDVRAPARLRSLAGGPLAWEDEPLTPAQERLVAHVREFGTEKNPGLDLTRVWIGGRPFKSDEMAVLPLPSTQRPRRPFLPPGHPGNAELDATMDYLDILTQDLVKVLPVRSTRLVDDGFRQIGQDTEEDDDDDDDDSSTDGEQDREKPTREAVQPQPQRPVLSPAYKVVVRPPRPPLTFHRPSKCGNVLLASAQKARRARPDAPNMTFVFRPTTDWYREQADEGRGFEHVHVDAWQTFFRTYSVGVPAKSRDTKP